jgi:hypothetical protein
MRNETAGEGPARPAGLWLQVVALCLAAFVPMAWLIGRRTVPAPAPAPLVLNPSEPIVSLQPSAEGLRAGPSPTRLPHAAADGGVFRLELVPGAGDPAAHPPYRLKLDAPGGKELWQGSWAGTAETKLQIVLPAEGLRPGPHTIVTVDSTGRLRSFPFLVP